MILFGFLLVTGIAFNQYFAFDSNLFPKSSSFHHVLDFLSVLHQPIDSLPNVSLTLSSLFPLVIKNSSCYNDLTILEKSFFEKQRWALKVLDAWGTKLPSGILEGSHLWLGSYDECLNLLYIPENRTFVSQPYPTHYCTLSKKVEDDQSILVQNGSLMIGICLPASCHADVFHSDSIALRCSTEKAPLSLGVFITIGLILILTLFIILSSFIPCLHEFSMKSSLKKCFSENHNHSKYQYLNGVRILSLLWIIAGHSLVFQLTVTDNIISVLKDFHQSLLMQLILSAVFAVDSFFFLSGFFAVFILLKKFPTPNTFRLRHLFVYYIHRYIRLMPALLFVLLISIFLSPWMGSGPIFPSSTGYELNSCRYQWWTNLLFINNLYKPDRTCLPVTWYLANDFQFHLLAPLLMIPFMFNHRRSTYVLLFILLLIHLICMLAIISTNAGFELGFVQNNAPSVDFFEKVYIAPWCRIAPFLIGMLTKLFISQTREQFSWKISIIGSLMASILAIFCIFLPFYSNTLPRSIQIIYQSSSHLCWSLAFAWFLVLCSFHSTSFIRKFLSWHIWTILARLSYSAFLLHTFIILTEIYNRSTTLHYQMSIIFNGFLSQTLWTFIFSIIIVVLVEFPMATIEKKVRHYFQEKSLVNTEHSSYGTID